MALTPQRILELHGLRSRSTGPGQSLMSTVALFLWQWLQSWMAVDTEGFPSADAAPNNDRVSTLREGQAAVEGSHPER